MKTNNGNAPEVPTHIEDDDLIAYLDGERDPETQKSTQLHLESCWYCRIRVSTVERSIENFLSLRQNELLPKDVPPSGPAVELFKARLASHQTRTPSHSFIRQYTPRFRSFLRRLGAAANFNSYSLRTQVFATRSLAAVAMAGVVFALVLFSGRLSEVSAAEVLKLSIEAQAQRLEGVPQPVMRQRIEIRSSRRAGNPLVWELWNDTTNGRVSTRIEGDSTNSVVNDLIGLLRDNHMNEHRPLSAASFKSWADSISSKTEEVASGEEVGGEMVFRVTTTDENAKAVGAITSASLSVRESDYHPVALSVKTRTETGEAAFDLIEQQFQVVSLKDLDRGVFSDPTKIEVASTVGMPMPDPEKVSQDSAVVATKPVMPEKDEFPKATTADEIEVLDLLNRAGADITEQLSVTRAADGRLLVEGLVETEQRKSEILDALSPAKSNRAVRIRIQTIEEAAKALQQQKVQGTPGVVDHIEVEKGQLPADADLRRHFESRGGDTEAEIAKFASRVVARSQAAAFQASALNRMVRRFSPEEIAAMDKDARTKWLRILKGYAAAVRRETAALRSDLQPIFGGFEEGGTERISTNGELISAARTLYDAASANDRAVRSSFMLSSGGGSAAAIRSAQFRRSIAAAEALASAIERFQ